MANIYFYNFVIALLLTFITFCEGEECEECCSCFQASIDYHAGRGLGYDKSYGSLSFFGAPKSSLACPYYFFFDIRSHLFTNEKLAGNIGVGVRYKVGQMTLGANLYYDIRNSHHRYQQFGPGIELLSPCLDLRLNGYFPQKKSHLTECAFFNNFIGDYFETCKLHEFAYTGFDAEIGRSFYSTTDCRCYFSLYAALGTYYFHAKKGCDFWGGQARVRLNFTQFIAVDVLASSDRVFCDRVQGIISFSIPFGPCSYSCREAPLCTPPFRREIIILDKRCHYKNNF